MKKSTKFHGFVIYQCVKDPKGMQSSKIDMSIKSMRGIRVPLLSKGWTIKLYQGTDVFRLTGNDR